jgi:hypothetical protein
MTDNTNKPASAPRFAIEDSLPGETNEQKVLRLRAEQMVEMKANAIAAEAFLKSTLCQQNANFKAIFTSIVEANDIFLQKMIIDSIAMQLRNVVPFIESCKTSFTGFRELQEGVMTGEIKLMGKRSNPPIYSRPGVDETS